MKFKNSYTLLIAIAILLISIGSVCASENITADNNDVLADTDEKVVLENENIEIVSATGNITTNVDTSQNEYTFNENEEIKIPTTIKDNESNEITVTSDDLSVYENTTPISFNYTDNGITIQNILSTGKHSLIINYLGNATYANSSKTITIEMNNNATPTKDTFDIDLNNVTSVNVNSTKKGEIKFKIVGDVDFDSLTKTVTITYKNGDKTETITPKSLNIVNGLISFEFDDLKFTNATLTMKFDNVSKNVTLKRVYNYKLNPKTTSADYEDGSFTFEVVDADDNTIIANKSISISLKQDKVNGTTLYFITSNGGGSYSLGTSKTLTTDANGIATLVNKGFYPGFVMQEVVYAPVGSYIVIAGNTGNMIGSGNNSITINPIDVNFELLKFNEEYETKKMVTLKVTNAKTGKIVTGSYVVLNITDVNVTNPMQMTDNDGTIKINVSRLPPNTYKMTFVTNDTSLNNKSGSGSFTIKKITVKINAKNVKISYNTGKTYTIKVTKGGKALKNAYITVKLYTTSKKYIKFNASTNKKGKFSFTASLNKGKHKIIISDKIDPRYKGTTVKKTITVKKASGKFQAKNLKAKSNSKKKFTIKLINKNNKKPIFNAKVNIKLYLFNTNKYYNFNGNTGSNGVIKLSLKNLQRGKYNVYISGNDKKNYNAKTLKKLLVIK